MNDNVSEAVLVAVAMLFLWLFADGISIIPERFSIRKLFIWTTIIAVVIGAIAVLARIKS
jgi:hypothetical protein